MDFSTIQPLLPTGDVLPLIEAWTAPYDFDLKITRPRKSKLGDFKPPKPGKRSSITMNEDLGPYQFLTTFVHELAHLITWEKYGHRAAPHGKEWKQCFGALLISLAEVHPWPEVYKKAILEHATRPKSAVGGDPGLQSILLQLDGKDDEVLLQDLAPGDEFNFKTRRFRYQKCHRTRALVLDLGNKRLYTIPLVARIDPAD